MNSQKKIENEKTQKQIIKSLKTAGFFDKYPFTGKSVKGVFWCIFIRLFYLNLGPILISDNENMMVIMTIRIFSTILQNKEPTLKGNRL